MVGFLDADDLKKLQEQAREMGGNEDLNDLSTSLNWLVAMELVNSFVKVAMFATEEQAKEIEKIARKVNMSLDIEQNENHIKSHAKFIQDNMPKNEKQGIKDLYSHLAYVGMSLGIGHLDPKQISVVEFTELTELAKKQHNGKKTLI